MLSCLNKYYLHGVFNKLSKLLPATSSRFYLIKMYMLANIFCIFFLLELLMLLSAHERSCKTSWPQHHKSLYKPSEDSSVEIALKEDLSWLAEPNHGYAKAHNYGMHVYSS